MKVLLIFPPTRTEIDVANHPPLGISYLASILMQVGHSVSLLDMRIKSHNKKYLINCLINEKPDLVGLSSPTYQFKKTVAVAKTVKKYLPSAIIVLGGPHASLVPELILKQNDIFDYLILGEGEETLIEFCQALEMKEEISEIKGIAYKNEGVIFKTLTRPPIERLDSLPFPNFDGLPLKEYGEPGWIPIITSRGCPFRCIFCCAYTIYGRKFRARSPKNVVDEIEFQKGKYGVSNFVIWDDNFSFDVLRAETICNEIIDRDLNIKWRCDGGLRVDRISKQLVKKMKLAGCVAVSIGIESADPTVLKRIKKGTTVKQVVHAIQLFKEERIIVTGFFVVGTPCDNYESVMKSIRFFKTQRIDLPFFFNIIPYPKTEIWNWMLQNAFILKDASKYLEEVTRLGETVDVVYETSDFKKEDRLAAYKKACIEAEKWRYRSTFGVFGVILYHGSKLMKRIKYGRNIIKKIIDGFLSLYASVKNRNTIKNRI